MVVIKINEIPRSKEGLRNRVRKNWRINSSRLLNQETLIGVNRGEILEVYKILNYGPSKEKEGRIEFELEEIESNLKGRKIDYKTANPCTIVEKLEFK